MSTAELPYGGTSGYSSQAGKATVTAMDADGRTASQQQRTLGVLSLFEASGATWHDLSEMFGWHHGAATRVLSVLHKANRIKRLTERRNNSAVYVLPEYVNGRDTESQGRRSKVSRERIKQILLTPDLTLDETVTMLLEEFT